jgi:hypothetical protein
MPIILTYKYKLTITKMLTYGTMVTHVIFNRKIENNYYKNIWL